MARCRDERQRLDREHHGLKARVLGLPLHQEATSYVPLPQRLPCLVTDGRAQRQPDARVAVVEQLKQAAGGTRSATPSCRRSARRRSAAPTTAARASSLSSMSCRAYGRSRSPASVSRILLPAGRRARSQRGLQGADLTGHAGLRVLQLGAACVKLSTSRPSQGDEQPQFQVSHGGPDLVHIRFRPRRRARAASVRPRGAGGPLPLLEKRLVVLAAPSFFRT